MGVGIGRAVLQAMLQVIISCFNITWWGNKVKKKKWLRGNLREEGEKQSMASSGVWPRGPLTPRAPLLLSRSVMSDSATSWTVAHQAPLSMGFSRQEYLIGLPCPSPEDLSNQGIEHPSLMSPTLAGRFFNTSATIRFFLVCMKEYIQSQAMPLVIRSKSEYVKRSESITTVTDSPINVLLLSLSNVVKFITSLKYVKHRNLNN